MSKRKRPPGPPGDPFEDPEWKAYVTHVQTELVPMIKGSTIGMSIVPTNPEDVDVKFAVELGLMVMLDKPIMLVCRIGSVLPERLKRVADEIVFADDFSAPEAQEQIMAAISRMQAKGDDGV